MVSSDGGLLFHLRLPVRSLPVYCIRSRNSILDSHCYGTTFFLFSFYCTISLRILSLLSISISRVFTLFLQVFNRVFLISFTLLPEWSFGYLGNYELARGLLYLLLGIVRNGEGYCRDRRFCVSLLFRLFFAFAVDMVWLMLLLLLLLLLGWSWGMETMGERGVCEVNSRKHTCCGRKFQTLPRSLGHCT